MAVWDVDAHSVDDTVPVLLLNDDGSHVGFGVWDIGLRLMVCLAGTEVVGLIC